MLALTSCRDTSKDWVKEGKFETYTARIGIDGMGRKLALNDKNGAWLLAQDYQNDGRFDMIDLKDSPKGHQFEKLANLITLEKIYAEIKKQ